MGFLLGKEFGAAASTVLFFRAGGRFGQNNYICMYVCMYAGLDTNNVGMYIQYFS